MSDADVRIRTATAADASIVHGLIRELAVYERLEHEVAGEPHDLIPHLEGDPPLVEALLAEDVDGTALGFALTYTTFSTFQCRPGVYIEDLFVVPQARGRGVGGALLRSIAGRAVERGYGRMEWSVLDWNEPAIGFYRRLGGRPVEGWTRYRLAGDDLVAASRAVVADAER